MVFAHQPSLLASLEPDEELLDSIIMPDDERWSEAVLEWLEAKYFCIDIETCPRPQYLDHPHYALNPWKGLVRLIQIGLPSEKVLIVDLGKAQQEERKEKGEFAKSIGFFEILRDRMFDDSVTKVGQNLKFDLLYLYLHYQSKTRKIRDTMILSKLYWAGLEHSHSLKSICERLGIEIDKTEQKSDWSWDLTNKQINYAARDVVIPAKVWKQLGALIQNDPYSPTLKGSVIASCESIPAFVEMEAYGVPVDRTLLEENLKAYQEAADDVIKPFLDKFPHVNPNSSKQLLPIIQETWGITPLGKNQKTGELQPSVSAEALAQFWNIPELRSLSLYGTLQTQIKYMKSVQDCLADYPTSQYYPYAKGIYFVEAPEGFGRPTCKSKDETQDKPKKIIRKGVNLLNPPSKIPKPLKKYKLPKFRRFFRPKEGFAFIVGDLSQAHARIACEGAQDPMMLDIYNNDFDGHCIMAEKLARAKGLSWTFDDIKKWAKKLKSHPNHEAANSLRELAKTVYYSALNGSGAGSIKDSCDTKDMPIDMDTAKAASAAWKETYKVLFKFMHKIVEEANSYNYQYKGKTYGIVKGLGGRRIFMEKKPSKYRPNDPPSVNFNKACSFFWTSTESDAVKLALAGLWEDYCNNPQWGARFAETCYDEIGSICYEEYWMEVAYAKQKRMQEGMELFIKSIPVDEKPLFKLQPFYLKWLMQTHNKPTPVKDKILTGYWYYLMYGSVEGMIVESWADK